MKKTLKRGTIGSIAAATGVSHSAVSQWFSGKTAPSAKAVAIMHRDFNIPATAWLDIKAYLNDTPATQDGSRVERGKSQPKDAA